MPTSRKPAVTSVTCRTLTVCVIACCGNGTPALAQNVLEPYLGYSYGVDDNVFGLSSDDQYLRLLGRPDGSDTTRSARAGVKLAYRLSRQTFDVNAELSHTRYAHFRALDYNGRNLQATWHWVAGNTWQGALGATNVQSASQFSNVQQIVRNLRTDSEIYASAAWKIAPTWRVTANGSKFALRYDLPSQQYSNIDQNKLDAGLSYVAGSGSTFGLLTQQINGTYPNRIHAGGQSEDFRQREVKGNVDWLATGKTRVQLLVGWTSRDSASVVRDFSGPTARAIWIWTPSGKTTLISSVWKEVSAVDDALASYSVNKGAALSPSWSVSAKITLQADLRYEKRDFQGSALATYDTDRSASLSVAYTPIRSTLVKLSGFVLSRQGNAYGGGYKRHGATLSIAYHF